MDTEHSYYARVLDEVERLQPVGAGGGILVLNLMYPCFEPGARVGMDLSVRSGEDAFPVGTWKVGMLDVEHEHVTSLRPGEHFYQLVVPCAGMALIIAGPNGWACFGTRILIAAALQ